MKTELIESAELFQGIKGDSLERMLVCANVKLRHYRRGMLIFGQTEKPNSVFVLLRGRVGIVKNLASGRRSILYEVEEGSIFGEHYFAGADETYWHEAEAFTEIDVMEIPWGFFFGFCEEACEHHKQLLKNFLAVLLKKECFTMRKLHIVSAASLKERISIWLLEEADADGIVRLKMKREELASFLGVARPSLSRALMRLREA